MTNVITLIGRIGRDAEAKMLPSGTSILSFSIANDTGYGDKKKTTWYRVSVFGKRAEGGLKTFLVKGQAVFVSGELSANEYETGGITKTSLDILANVIGLVGNKHEAVETGGNNPAKAAPATKKAAEMNAKSEVPFDDDIPF